MKQLRYKASVAQPTYFSCRNFKVRSMLGALAVLVPHGCDSASLTTSGALDALPILEFVATTSIGGAEAVGPAAFGRIRAVALVGKQDGLFVFDGLTQTAHYFTIDGVYLRSIGRKGAGPGESRAVAVVAATPSGGLCMWDPQLHRISQFDSLGSVIHAGSADLQPIRAIVPGFVGFRNDCSFVFADRQQVSPARSGSESMVHDTLRFLLYTAKGSLIRTLAVREDAPTWWHRTDHSSTNFRPLFGIELVSVLTDAGLLLGTTDSLKWDRIGFDGSGLGEVRFQTQIENVAKAEVELERERLIGLGPREIYVRIGLAEQRQVTRKAALLEVPARSTLPAYDRIIAGAGGVFWFRKAPRPLDEKVTWFLVNSESKLEGRVTLARSAEVKAASKNVLIVVSKDEFDAPVLTVFRRSQ